MLGWLFVVFLLVAVIGLAVWISRGGGPPRAQTWPFVALPFAGALLTGCPSLPPPDGCTPIHSRCSPKGVPQVCSQTQRWTEIGEPCASVGAVCCFTRSPYGREIHACVPADSCIPEPVDAGTDTDATDTDSLEVSQ